MFGLKHRYQGNVIKGIIEDSELELKHTPDVLRLEQRANWNVFLYCDMQHLHPRAIDYSDYEGWGYTKEHYTMWKNDLGKLSHPVVFNHDARLRDVPHSRVRGEIVRMRTPRLIELDGERQNGVQFQRVRVQISVPHFILVPEKDRSTHQKLHGHPYLKGDYSPIACESLVWAWMYVGRKDFWLNEPFSVSTTTIKSMDKRIGHFDWKVEKSALLVMGAKTRTIPSVKQYLPNQIEKNEPYYYFSPTECT